MTFYTVNDGENVRLSQAAVLNIIASNARLYSVPALTQTMHELIVRGDIPSGTRLPTIRDLAERLGIGKSTIAAVWTRLSENGLVITQGKSGTIVLPRPDYPHARRYTQMMKMSHVQGHIDLGNVISLHLSNELIREAVDHAFADPEFNSVNPVAATPSLTAACRGIWPFDGACFLACQGLPDALHVALSSFVSRGDTVLVQTPAVPRVLDILDSLRVTVIPFDASEGSRCVGSIRHALNAQPALMILQPTNAVPTGSTVTPEWLSETANIIRHKVRVIEIEQNPFHSMPAMSFGSILDGQVIRIVSFSMAFGHDLPLSVIGSDAETIRRLSRSLSFSSRWVSRLMQDAAAWLLTDPAAVNATETLVRELDGYARRLRVLLRSRGINMPDSTAPQLWIPTEDETVSVMRMLDSGYITYPGRFFTVGSTSDFLRSATHISGTTNNAADRLKRERRGHFYLNPAPVRDRLDAVSDAIVSAVTLSTRD